MRRGTVVRRCGNGSSARKSGCQPTNHAGAGVGLPNNALEPARPLTVITCRRASRLSADRWADKCSKQAWGLSCEIVALPSSRLASQ